jgi:3-hydroxyisobutyrate dehydrogenase-like beta-hydroxyacid dehydrogenase
MKLGLVGLVGLGRMGAAIAQRLGEQGCEVIAWDRSDKAREAQRKRGLRVVDGPRAVASAANVVLSIITEDKGVRQVFTGPDGFLSGDVAGKLFIEMSTLQPATHRELAPLVKAKGASLVDSPVMGSIPTVREGKLLALLGGEPADVERARAVLDHLTRRIAHIGPNGAGCAMKLAINLGMAIYLQSLGGALSRGPAAGRRLDQLLDIFAEAPTASPWLKGKVGVLKGEPSDITLDVRTMRKDVMSAIATGARNGVIMPAAAGTLASLSAAVAGGWGEKDLAEVPRYFREFMLQVYD